jgi:poly [ADP-ribose] polymerase
VKAGGLEPYDGILCAGKLTPQQIKAGYSALHAIEKLIEKKEKGRKLVDACNDYYTRIPHCFGMRTPPLIGDERALRSELQLMEALADIEVAVRTLRDADAETLAVCRSKYTAFHAYSGGR